MGRAKRLRIAQLERDRLDRLASGQETPQDRKVSGRQIMYVRCGKCKLGVPDYRFNDHMKACQPAGGVCGVCRRFISLQECGGLFVEHLRSCKGPTLAEALGDMATVAVGNPTAAEAAKHLCVTCQHEYATCEAKHITWGIDRNAEARGAEADMVLECDAYLAKTMAAPAGPTAEATAKAKITTEVKECSA